MSAIDYTAIKKGRELEVVKKVYVRAEEFIKSTDQEKPDFLLDGFPKGTLLGVEVTELYQNESSARLKRIPGYADLIYDTRKFRHKDDPGRLIPDEFDLLDEMGNTVQVLKGVWQNLPSVNEFINLVEGVIQEKVGKLANYTKDAAYNILLISDTEGYFGGTKLTDLYASLFSPKLETALFEAGFREVYFIGQLEHKNKHLPMKGYLLYAYSMQFESYFIPTMQGEILILDYLQVLVGVLSQTGLKDAVVHQGEGWYAISYGDISLRYDLTDFAKRTMVYVNMLDYQDGMPISSYAERLVVDPVVVEGFRHYRETKSFHSDFAMESYL
jgi:hypothetical protein